MILCSDKQKCALKKIHNLLNQMIYSEQSQDIRGQIT